MSLEHEQQLFKKLEEAKRNWQEKRAYYEVQRSTTASPALIFELEKGIQECQKEIQRISSEIYTLSEAVIHIQNTSQVTEEKELSAQIPPQKIVILSANPKETSQILGKKYPDTHPAIPKPISQQKSQPTPVSSPQYKSDEVAPFPQGGVDYAPLNDLLAAENWKEADQETMRIMLEIADREESGWLQKEHIQKLSDETLDTINKLWIHHSKGQFGFSVQAKIWLECKGEPGKFNYTIYQDKFCVRTGWRVNKSWLKRYDNFQFSLDAQKGHFPSLSFPDIKDQGISWKNWKETFENILPRLFTCLSTI